MLETMIMTNKEIYEKAVNLTQNFPVNEIKLPVKVGFYINKNSSELLALGQEIENERVKIYSNNGIFNEETNQYEIDEGKMDEVNKELTDLLEIEQEVDIYKIDLDLFDGVELSASQISLISFMIEE